MKPIIKADAVPTIFKREPPQTKKLILKIKAWQITIITLPQNSENKHQGLYHNELHRLSNQKNFVYLAEIGD